MRSRRVSMFVSALTLAVACTSSRAPVIQQGAEPPPVVMTAPGSTDVRTNAEVRAIERVIPVPLDTAWVRLAAAWASLDIPVREANPRGGTLRSDRFRARSNMTGRPMRESVDCGYSVAGQRADLWDVYLEVTSAIRPEGGPANTRVSTVIVASARPRDGSGTPPVSCSSLGRIEGVIADRVRNPTS
jgi:hypothetical protein